MSEGTKGAGSTAIEYNERPHQSRWCFGKTRMQTFLASNSDDPADESA